MVRCTRAKLLSSVLLRFDERRPGEPALKLSGKKRSFRDNIADAGSDKVSSVGFLFWIVAATQILMRYCIRARCRQCR
jgi:hypothetical protein